MTGTNGPDTGGLRGATYVLELEGDWRFLDPNADRAGVAGEIFAGYDARAFLSGDAGVDARAIAGHALHHLLAEAADYHWLDWCEHYHDRRTRSTVAATSLLALPGGDGGDAATSRDPGQAASADAILGAAFGPATRPSGDTDLADLALPPAEAAEAAVRRAHAGALAAPPARSPWLVDRLAVEYARAVAEYNVPGYESYDQMFALAERMADSYEGALALGLPPEWAVEAAQLVNWSDDLLASPSGYTMQVYMYKDTVLRDHAAELADAAVRAYLAARDAGRGQGESEVAAVGAFRAALIRYTPDMEDDDGGERDLAEQTALMCRLIAVYERIAGGAALPAAPPAEREGNPLLSLVQGVTGVYRDLRASGVQPADPPGEDGQL